MKRVSHVCSGDYGIGFYGLSHNMGAYLVRDHLGLEWLCFLCTAQVQEPRDCRETPEASFSTPSTRNSNGSAAPVRLHSCKAETTLVVGPRDAYRRRIFLQPWGLYLFAEAGCIHSLRISVLAGIITVTFEEPDMLLNTRNRLRLEQTSELEHHQDMSMCLLEQISRVDSNLQPCIERFDPNQENDESGRSAGVAAARHLMRSDEAKGEKMTFRMHSGFADLTIDVGSAGQPDITYESAH